MTGLHDLDVQAPPHWPRVEVPRSRVTLDHGLARKAASAMEGILTIVVVVVIVLFVLGYFGRGRFRA